MFTAYYDLTINPPTYDAVSFLLQVEQERLRRNSAVTIRVLPGAFRHTRWQMPSDGQQALVDRIILPMFRMLPGADVVMLPHRYDLQPGYQSSLDNKSLYSLLAQTRPLRPKAVFKLDPLLITMTLRECDFWPTRNSQTDQWCHAAAMLHLMSYRVVVVRDTRLADVPLDYSDRDPRRRDEHVYFTQDVQAATDLEIRAALYRSAACNMFVSNGPAWFAMALDAPVVMLRPTCETAGVCATSRYLAQNGIPPKGQLPGAPEHIRLVWQDDTAENIVAAACDYVENSRK